MIKKIKGSRDSEPHSFGLFPKEWGEHTGRVFGHYKKKEDAEKRFVKASRIFQTRKGGGIPIRNKAKK